MSQFKVSMASSDIIKGQSIDKLMGFTRAEVDFQNFILESNVLRNHNPNYNVFVFLLFILQTTKRIFKKVRRKT